MVLLLWVLVSEEEHGESDREDFNRSVLNQLADAHIATFLIPLPEPLPLPDRVPITTVELEADHDRLARVASRLADPADLPRIEHHVSLLLHQVSNPVNSSDPLDVLMRLAAQVLPWAVTDNDRVVQRVGGLTTNAERVWRRLSSRVKAARRSGALTASTADAGDLREVDATIIEAAVYLPDVNDTDAISDAFDEAVTCIRKLQESYYQVRRRPLTLCRRETLPLMVPFAVGQLRFETPPRLVSGLNMFLTNTNTGAFTRDEPLTDDEEELLAVTHRRPPHAFSDHLDLLREAQLATQTRGDHRAAAVMAGAASETFLDTLLLHLLWEECTTPEDAASIFADPRRALLARTKRELATRVGGTWNEHERGPFARWHQACYLLRHRAVHAAYFPTAHEVHAAIAAINDLVAMVGQRLREPTRTGRYPRTTIMLAGESKLRNEGRWRGKIQRVAADPTEPNWAGSFRAWSAVVQLHRDMLAGAAPVPDAARARLLLVLNAASAIDGHRWVLHDHDTAMACLSSRPVEADTEPLAGTLQTVTTATASLDVAAHSMLMSGGNYTATPIGDWVPAHQLVPEAAVMRDRSDPGLR